MGGISRPAEESVSQADEQRGSRADKTWAQCETSATAQEDKEREERRIHLCSLAAQDILCCPSPVTILATVLPLPLGCP